MLDVILRSEVHFRHLRIAGAALCQQPHVSRRRLVIFQSIRRGERCQHGSLHARFRGFRAPELT